MRVDLKKSSDSLVEDGKIIASEYRETKQTPVHVKRYQYEWIQEKKEVDKFNFSEFVRMQLNKLIEQDSIDIPEKTLTTPEKEQEEKDGIEVFITED